MEEKTVKLEEVETNKLIELYRKIEEFINFLQKEKKANS